LLFLLDSNQLMALVFVGFWKPHVELLGENRKPHSAYDRTHQKAILRRYRVASKAIYEVLGCSGAMVERAGIDESYLDLTDLVQKRIETMVSMTIYCLLQLLSC
jgi:hypothetical protein